MNILARLLPLLRFALSEFGPLIIFWILAAALGTKAAIAGSVLFIIADGVRRWRWRLPVTRLYLFSSFLTVAFGAIDLFAVTPFMLKYEFVITNIATGLAFVLGARGAKPMLQELAEQRRSESFPEGPDIKRFFQIFTLLWAFYFFVKAAFYYWLGMIMPLTEAMALRSIIGSVSFGLMIVLSNTQGRRLFMLLRRIGLLPYVERKAA